MKQASRLFKPSPLSLAVLVGCLSVLFPILKNIDTQYRESVLRATRSEVLIHLRSLSEYFNSQLRQYETLLDLFPESQDFQVWISLFRKNATRIYETTHVWVTREDGTTESAWHPPTASPVHAPIVPDSSFYCGVYTHEGEEYLLVSKKYYPPAPRETYAVNILLRTLQLLPEHTLFPYPALLIALVDVNDRSLLLYPLGQREEAMGKGPPPFGQQREMLIKKTGLGSEIQGDTLWGWDALRGYPLRVVFALDMQEIVSKNNQRTLTLFTLGYSIALFLWFLGFILYRYQKERLQHEREIVLRDMVLRETHHRIKNNVQTLTSLFDLQRDALKDSMVQEAFSAAIARLRIIALLHEELYRQDSLDSLQVSAYLDRLLRHLSALYNLNGKQITLHTSMDPDVRADAKIARAFGFILHEFITNTLKHAFPAGQSGSVWVYLLKGETSVTLELANDGVPYDASKSSGGLGFTIIQSMATQFQGTLRVHGTHGLKIQVEIPVYTNSPQSTPLSTSNQSDPETPQYLA